MNSDECFTKQETSSTADQATVSSHSIKTSQSNEPSSSEIDSIPSQTNYSIDSATHTAGQSSYGAPESEIEMDSVSRTEIYPFGGTGTDSESGTEIDSPSDTVTIAVTARTTVESWTTSSTLNTQTMGRLVATCVKPTSAFNVSTDVFAFQALPITTASAASVTEKTLGNQNRNFTKATTTKRAEKTFSSHEINKMMYEYVMNLPSHVITRSPHPLSGIGQGDVSLYRSFPKGHLSNTNLGYRLTSSNNKTSQPGSVKVLNTKSHSMTTVGDMSTSASDNKGPNFDHLSTNLLQLIITSASDVASYVCTGVSETTSNSDNERKSTLPLDSSEATSALDGQSPKLLQASSFTFTTPTWAASAPAFQTSPISSAPAAPVTATTSIKHNRSTTKTTGKQFSAYEINNMMHEYVMNLPCHSIRSSPDLRVGSGATTTHSVFVPRQVSRAGSGATTTHSVFVPRQVSRKNEMTTLHSGKTGKDKVCRPSMEEF